MLLELLATTSMAGVAGASYVMKNRGASSDHEKIVEIAREAGLTTKKGGIRIYRKSRNKEKQYTEYVYKLPLGLSLKQFQEKLHLFEDGLNIKSKRELRLSNVKELKEMNWGNLVDLSKQLQDTFFPHVHVTKHVELSYDGMLKFTVYEKELERFVPYTQELLEKTRHWEIPIGLDLNGWHIHDFEKMQMMVVAGMTRYGKTVFLKSIIATLIHNEPDNVEFTLIDLKGGLAFNRFFRCKQVKTVAKNAKETLAALKAIHKEMLMQQRIFLRNGWEDIGEAGYKKRHFVIIDEGAEIAGFADKDTREQCTHLVGEIARIGAGLGYRVVFCTQYPTSDVFPRSIKSNISASISFRLKTATQSMVVLDRPGANDLPVGQKGRAIYQTDQDVIVQTPFITNEFIDEIITPHLIEKEMVFMDDEDEDGKHETEDVNQSQERKDAVVFEEV